MTLFPMLICCALAQTPDNARTELVDFGAEVLPEFVVLNNAGLERVPHEEGFARKVVFHKVDWPNVFFKAPEGVWDWSRYAGVAVSLYNSGDETVQVAMRVDNAGADGQNHCNNAGGGVTARQRFVLSLRFNTGLHERLWGMRGLPGGGAIGTGPTLDTAKITAFQVFLPRPRKEHTLIFEKAWLFGEAAATGGAAKMPFIDRFGQYKHADWPGKVHDAAELATQASGEKKALAAQRQLPGRDAYGGWAGGPQLEATGWFRTEEVDGKWWLVTPEGHLFFSLGVDCVGTWERTFVTGRDAWFEWLPGSEEPEFQGLYQDVANAHSGADAIGGKGRTFSFYCANLFRKYGKNWPKTWRESSYTRLRSWGFNTIANWSQDDVLKNSPMPFVVSTGISGVRPIAGGTGYWSKMIDVYAPEFPERVDAAFARVKDAYSGNPLCIGYFVDNELAWEGIAKGVLASPADQPCRVAFVEILKTKYAGIEALNTAWGAKAGGWEDLHTPAQFSPAARDDFDAFLYAFARRYFETVQRAVEKHAPHQLYLGCRFSSAPDFAVRAAADVIDVVSYNLYYPAIPQDKWAGEASIGKPIMIGEFHFGALDRGMFHTGLVATANQQERAESYMRYIRSVADHPAFVGCHWFQYIDEPNTGRWFDGENYNIGFLDVTDTPYPEMVQAARQVHAEIYERRYGRPAPPGPSKKK